MLLEVILKKKYFKWIFIYIDICGVNIGENNLYYFNFIIILKIIIILILVELILVWVNFVVVIILVFVKEVFDVIDVGCLKFYWYL